VRITERSGNGRRSALTDLVGSDDVVMFGKDIELMLERMFARVATAMQQYQRRAVTAHGVEEFVPVDLGHMPCRALRGGG
jgi:hypothetical protein